jgi:hypothetical protein
MDVEPIEAVELYQSADRRVTPGSKWRHLAIDVDTGFELVCYRRDYLAGPADFDSQTPSQPGKASVERLQACN